MVDTFLYFLIIAIPSTGLLLRSSRIKHIKNPTLKNITSASFQIGVLGSISAIFWGVAMSSASGIVEQVPGSNNQLYTWLLSVGIVLAFFGGVFPIVGIIFYNRTVGKVIKSSHANNIQDDKTILAKANKYIEAENKPSKKLVSQGAISFVAGWITAGIITLSLLGLAGAIQDYRQKELAEATQSQQQIAEQQLYPIHQDPELLRIIEEIRTDKDTSLSDLKLVWENPDTEWAAGDQLNAQGNEPARIRIRPDTDRYSLWSVLAHEYVHYRWDNDYDNPDNQIALDLRNKVWNDPYFIERTQNYNDSFADSENGEYSRYEEAMAYGCVELADWRLTPHLVSECNRIIDRSKLAQFLR